MTTTLRQVLQIFAEAQEPLSLSQMARQLAISPGVLEGMIDHWVRKGRVREVNPQRSGCATCGDACGCPWPRRYELVTRAETPTGHPPTPGCPRCP